PYHRLQQSGERGPARPGRPRQRAEPCGILASRQCDTASHKQHGRLLCRPYRDCSSPTGCPLSSPQQAVGHPAGFFVATVMHRRDIGLRVGCAGWAIPSQHAHAFPVQGTHLERYAQRFTGAEVNSSFYRPHRPTTYARWAASVPDQFQFAVKMPQEITHTRRLVAVTAPLECFLRAVQSLGPKLGPLLIQLPPSLHFAEPLAQTFWTALRTRFHGPVVCEPRHQSWFSPAAEQLLHAFQVVRVAADPARVPAAAVPGGWPGLV